MSRVGKLPVELPSGVTVKEEDSLIIVKGPKGELKTQITNDVIVTLEDKQIIISPANNTKQARSMWGTIRSILNNSVRGVSEGYVKNLEISGVGYRASVSKNILTMFLGYSHEIKYIIPIGVDIKCEKPTLLQISGIDKQIIGQVAAEIRGLRRPEPYKGKGIRYSDEIIRRKEGKKK